MKMNWLGNVVSETNNKRVNQIGGYCLCVSVLLASSNCRSATSENLIHYSETEQIINCAVAEKVVLQNLLSGISSQDKLANLEKIVGVHITKKAENQDLIGDTTVTEYDVPVAERCSFVYSEYFNKSSGIPTGFSLYALLSSVYEPKYSCISMLDVSNYAKAGGWNNIQTYVLLSNRGFFATKGGLHLEVRAGGGDENIKFSDSVSKQAFVLGRGCAQIVSIFTDR